MTVTAEPDLIAESGDLRTVAAAWQASAKMLAHWTMRLLVKRIDVWGGYLPERFRTESRGKVTKPAKKKRDQPVLTADVLQRHYRGNSLGDIAGLHAISGDEPCKRVGWDVDNRGGADVTTAGQYQSRITTSRRCGLSSCLADARRLRGLTVQALVIAGGRTRRGTGCGPLCSWGRSPSPRQRTCPTRCEPWKACNPTFWSVIWRWRIRRIRPDPKTAGKRPGRQITSGCRCYHELDDQSCGWRPSGGLACPAEGPPDRA